MLGLNINTKYGGLNNVLNGAIDNASGSLAAGSSVGGALGSTVQGLVSPYASLLNIVGLGGAFEKTFGSVLSNGFDVTCWGASQTPSRIKGVLSQHYQPYFQNLLSDVQNGDLISINRFVKDVYITHNGVLHMQTATSWAKCSRKGLALYMQFMDPLKQKADDLVDAMVGNGSKLSFNSHTGIFRIGNIEVDGSDKINNLRYPILASPPVVVPVLPPVVVEVPKIPLELSSLTPNRTLETITAELDMPINGGELENVIVKGSKVSNGSSSNEKSSFPWWIVVLGLGAM